MHDNIKEDESHPIGARIRSLRIARGWTLAELASRVGSSAPTIHRYESGWDRFEIATLRKIATALGVRLEVNLVERAGIGSEPAGKSSFKLLRLVSPLFWDRKLKRADLDSYPEWVLERVLMFGNRDQVAAARNFYGDAAITRAVGRRGVDPRTRNFWEIVLKGATDASKGTQ